MSRLICTIIIGFYIEAAGRPLLTGLVIAHQTFSDQLRWYPHFHTLVLEGGFDAEGRFVSIPFSGLQAITEAFRRRELALIADKRRLTQEFAETLLSWRHSGFSIDNSVRVTGARAQESLVQYIARPPISLEMIRCELYASRTKGCWNRMPNEAARAPEDRQTGPG